MKRFYIISILLSILATPVRFAFAQAISFDSDIRYKKIEDSIYVDLKADQKLEVKKGENALVLTKSGVPILIYSPMDDNSVLRFTQPNLQLLMQELLQTNLNIAINELVDGIRKTEALLQKREYQQSLIIISQLKSKYPRISEVLFLSGTIQYLSNNKSGAIEDLKAGLAIEPQNLAAQKLLTELTGSSR